MRASGGTNCAPPCVVVACTKSTIDFFAAPSFYDGSGSVCALAWKQASKSASAPNNILIEVARDFMPTPI